jgi:hypothetical protein
VTSHLCSHLWPQSQRQGRRKLTLREAAAIGGLFHRNFPRRKPRPLGRGGRRAALRLYVALDGFKGCAARRSGEIRGRPEGALVIAASNIRPCLSQHSAGCALQNIDQSRDRHLRRIFDQHVNVIGFTVAGDQPAIHGLADLTEMPGKPVQCGAIEYAASILGDTDQMHGKKRNAMSTAPKVLHVLLQTNHNAQ